MQGNEVANMNALLNIWANLSEILGVVYGTGFFWTAVVLGIMQRFSLAFKFIGLTVALFVYAFGIPKLVEMLQGIFATMPAVGMIVGGTGAILTGIGSLCLFCMPMFIGQRRRMSGVAVWNWCAFLFPPLWIVAFVKATSPAKQGFPADDDATSTHR
jgi:hypothetical protein